MIDALPLLLGDDGYQISRSVRLRSSASAYFNRTPASAGNRKTWTWSGWHKRGTVNSGPVLMQTNQGSNFDGNAIAFGVQVNDDFGIIETSGGTNTIRVATTALYRDPSAWYHLMVAVDTTQATASNRVKLYVNGVQQTALSIATYPSLNADTLVNQLGKEVGLGRQITTGGGAVGYLDGYLTEVNFIDGQALTPSSFGETNPITGVWQPKKYTGTYGTNGFYLNFSDNSNNTAATIGKDYSGNGNNWTPNNISVTAGVTYDSMLDVPTPWADGGNGRGNYCTLNPLINTAGYVTVAQGNLYASIGGQDKIPHATMQIPTSGKWYWEYTVSTVGLASTVGVSDGNVSQSSGTGFTGANMRSYNINGTKYNGAASAAYGASFTTNDIIGVAVDMDAGTIVFYKNNVSQGTAYSDLANGAWFPAVYINSANGHFNFGQRPFAYTPPSGFKALNTQNLPDVTIPNGRKFFDATLYTGNGAARSITGTPFQPDLVWIKGRSGATDHALYDAVRGVQLDLVSNSTAAETTQSTGLTAFNSDGFSIGTLAKLNTNTATYVGWQWKEGATQGFDIVTYTGNGANRTIAHNLGVAPSMMIVKNRSVSQTWQVYHAAIGAANKLNLNATDAASAGYWNNTAPTSSVFSVTSDGSVNASGNNYVAYLFSEVPGFSRFGSYTGNGSANGPFVFCGFRPRFVLYKRTDVSGTSWGMIDTARNTVNLANASLYANISDAEYTTLGSLDFVSNGFKIRSSDTNINSSGNTFIFAAFAEVPQKFSLAR